MKLSTKVRYGVRLMIDLAAQDGRGLVLLKDIARRQNISQKYLWQVIDALKSAKLVISGRGAKGGYMLAK
ncbi:MAG TPA: Rrf2 family transcriptional regulator, partial [Candidatus Sulfotelmatobacter sp.]|nr:Rrf2 family transcriptional regulator [Candidatus Sulfotelmatobacter sp.]